MNEVFIPYKNKHDGETCFIFGTGPSLLKFAESEYATKSLGCINIGVNEIIHYKIRMDYYFIGDAGNKNKGFNKNPEKYISYKPTIAKFFRSNQQIAQHIPQLPQDIDGVLYYKTTGWSFNHPSYKNGTQQFSRDIVAQMVDSGTIILEALQFALYCGFGKIYLVGCDCDYSKGTFNTNSHVDHGLKNFMLNSWQKVKSFIDMEYPQVKITTINPVGMDLFN